MLKVNNTIYRLSLTLLSLVLALSFTSQAQAAWGDVHSNNIITNVSQPTLSGYAHTWCEGGVDIQIASVYIGGRDMMSFSSSKGQVKVAPTYQGPDGIPVRFWSLDLREIGVHLPQGDYDTWVGYCYQQTNPTTSRGYYFPEATFYNSIRVVPAGCDEHCKPVYRFYDRMNGTHHFNANDQERRTLNMFSSFREEGVAGFVLDRPYEGSIAIHRFYNKNNGAHFYTTNQAEASYVNDKLFSVYRYEGIVGHTDASIQDDSVPVHRFYNKNNGAHFYTTNQAEASYVNDKLFSVYRYEGISYYLFR